MFKPGKEFDGIAKAVNGYARLDRAGEFRKDFLVSLPIVENYNSYHRVLGLLQPGARNCSTGPRALRSGSLSDRDITSTCNKLPANCEHLLVLRGVARAHSEICVVLSRAASDCNARARQASSRPAISSPRSKLICENRSRYSPGVIPVWRLNRFRKKPMSS